MEADQVRAVVEAWAAAVRAKNIESVLQAHSEDILLFDVIGPLRLEGLKEYRRTWLEEFFPWYGETGRFELVDLKVSAGSDLAFATSLIECAGVEDGKKVAFTLRLTVCLEKRKGAWTIVHEHHSQPIDFDTSHIAGGPS